ncbi:hypothetical protein [Streptomyces cavernicola]|uniref:Uncharacterized protein n=1 Tax=Streptomyces cavernicola TaxID=3043613 RepID=A0ABT6S2Q1_9ACTN|nr:hypothetical protein [Streptomyces sp. B-S-A6]MDI3402362.1 hypothetical protein [Streptomyces sp. B-S-A6]
MTGNEIRVTRQDRIRKPDLGAPNRRRTSGATSQDVTELRQPA